MEKTEKLQFKENDSSLVCIITIPRRAFQFCTFHDILHWDIKFSLLSFFTKGRKFFAHSIAENLLKESVYCVFIS